LYRFYNSIFLFVLSAFSQDDTRNAFGQNVPWDNSATKTLAKYDSIYTSTINYLGTISAFEEKVLRMNLSNGRPIVVPYIHITRAVTSEGKVLISNGQATKLFLQEQQGGEINIEELLAQSGPSYTVNSINNEKFFGNKKLTKTERELERIADVLEKEYRLKIIMFSVSFAIGFFFAIGS